MSYRIRTTLVDFLPGLVASRVGVLSLNWVNKLSVFFTFLSFTFLHFIVCLHDVGTLEGTYVICVFKVETSHSTSSN